MKDRIRGDYLVDMHGGVTHQLGNSGNGRYFAAFVQCGHCGTEYYIPAILTTKCDNVNSAKAILRNSGRVKKGRKGDIMDIFEITQSEAEYILEINFNHDPYFRNQYADQFDKRNEFIKERRVIHKEAVDKMMSDPGNDIYKNTHIRTRDNYNKLSNAFESNFAPILENGKFIFPDVDRNKAMNDFYRTTFKRIGLNKGNPFVLTYYYIMFGESEKYGLRVDGNNICYNFMNRNGKIEERKIEIPQVALEKLREAERQGRIGETKNKYSSNICNDPTRKLLKEFNFDDVQSSKPAKSRVDRFEARRQKHLAKLQSDSAELEL